MPVNKRWNMDELLTACDRYFEKQDGVFPMNMP